MGNNISEFVDVAIEVADLKVAQANFGIEMILPESDHAAFTARTKSYTSIDEVADDFATTTKTYKAAAKIFAQAFPPTTIIIGRADAADDNLTDTLNEIKDFDNTWYCLVAENRSKADILEIAAWIETQMKIYIACSEDAEVLDSEDATDIATALKALGYTRTYYFYHHQAGKNLGTITISVSSLVATVTCSSAHGLQVGDDVTITGATPSALNGNKLVATVPTTGTFTFETTAGDGAATGAITATAHDTFPDAALAGKMIGQYFPGEASFKFKTLTGINATPTNLMSSAEKAAALAKNANVYVEVASVGITQEGIAASGRYMDITIGMDYIQSQIESRIYSQLASLAKIPFTNAGCAIIENEIRAVLQEGIDRGILQNLIDDPNNLPYLVIVPDVADVSTANRTNRILPDVTFKAQLAGAIHKVIIRGKVSV
jgi:hypothetical protein